jgi:hypothetical protein
MNHDKKNILQKKNCYAETTFFFSAILPDTQNNLGVLKSDNS